MRYRGLKGYPTFGNRLWRFRRSLSIAVLIARALPVCGIETLIVSKAMFFLCSFSRKRLCRHYEGQLRYAEIVS
jgi:hypothetical protein